MNIIKQIRRDFSLSAFAAGFIVVLVGITSSALLVFLSAKSFGVDSIGASSWLGSLCFSMGLLSIVLSLKFKTPILIAWSTPAAAILAAGVGQTTLAEGIGAFLFSATLIFLSGITGFFEKMMDKIPLSLASALLAGVLIHFCIDAFSAFKVQPLLIGIMVCSYVIAKRFFSRYAMLAVLLSGLIISFFTNLLHFETVQLSLTKLHYVSPIFSLHAMLGLGLPIFIVTMTAQNIPGFTIFKSNGYKTSISPILIATGIGNFLIAPFGGFTLNLAAITAAIGMGPEAQENPNKRYIVGLVAGTLYLILGIFAGTVTSLFEAFPKELISGLVGIALLSTTANCLYHAVFHHHEREAAFLTFVITASGISLFGIASPFWGILVGSALMFLFSKKSFFSKIN